MYQQFIGCLFEVHIIFPLVMGSLMLYMN